MTAIPTAPIPSPDHHPSVGEWFEEARSAPAPSWVKLLDARCRYCGAVCHVYKNGRLASVHAGNWSYNCAARPWWTFGRGHKAK